MSDEEKAEYEVNFFDEETGTWPAEIDSAALNQWLFNKDTADKIREIVGLDRTAAQEAFAEFLTRGNLTADQMTFINQIIDHLVHNGTMDPNVLFGPPFTDFHDSGIVGVLPQDDQAIVRAIRRINDNALVA